MNKQKLAYIALIVMAIVWGYNWVVMKKVLVYVGPFDFSALRTLFGALALFVLMVARRLPMRLDKRIWFRVLILGLLQTAAFSLLIQLALLQGAAGNSSILVYTMPFWVIPMAWLSFGERIKGLQWLALAIAGVGLLLILEPWRAQTSYISELYAMGAGLCWAIASILAKSIKQTVDVPALQLTSWQMLCGATVLVITTLLVPEKPIDYSIYFFFALIYNAILATSFAWFLWLFALQYIPAGIAGIIALGVPAMSVLSSWVELGEHPAGAELTGMLLIVAALVLISVLALRPNKNRRAN